MIFHSLHRKPVARRAQDSFAKGLMGRSRTPNASQDGPARPSRPDPLISSVRFPHSLTACACVIVGLFVFGCATMTSHKGEPPGEGGDASDRVGVAYSLPKIKLRIVALRSITLESNSLPAPGSGSTMQTSRNATNIWIDYTPVTNRITNSLGTNLVLASATSTNAFGTNLSFSVERPGRGVLRTNLASTNRTVTVQSSSAGEITTISNAVYTGVLAPDGAATNQFKQVVRSFTNTSSELPGYRLATNYSVTVSNVVEPDPNHLYLLRLKPSWWSDDTFRISITSNGLLSAIGATNADQTGAIAIKVAQIGIQAFELAAGGMPLPSTAKAKGFRSLLDTNVYPEDAKGDSPLAIDYPPRIDITFDPTVETERTSAMAAFFRAGIDLRFSAPKTNRFDSWKSAPDGAASRAGIAGFFYRPLLPYQLMFEPYDRKSHTTNGLGVNSISVLLPNEAPVYVYDIRRAFGVTNAASASFENGFLKEVYLQKPSQLLAAVDIPLSILRSVAAIPTDLVQFRFNLATTNAALYRSQATEITNLLALIDAQRALILKLSATNHP